MWRSLFLMLPALIPSWRFFQTIEPSPRIEIAETTGPGGRLEWREFRPRPAQIGPWVMLRRLVWNPWWNECLYLTSLAERILADDRTHARAELRARIGVETAEAQAPRFRIVLVWREGNQVLSEVAYTDGQGA